MADIRTKSKPKNINEMMFDDAVRHLIGLERLEDGLTREFINTLNASDKEFLLALREGLNDVLQDGLTKAQQNKRISNLSSSLKGINATAYDALLAKVNAEMLGVITYEAEFTEKSFTHAFKSFGATPPELKMLSQSKAEYLLANHLVLSDTVGNWVFGMRDARLNAIMRTVKNGVIEDQTFKEIYDRVNGTKQKKYTDGDMYKARRSVETFSRTGVTALTTAARDELIRTNSDNFEGVQWVSVLDGRTTPICQSRAGKVYPIDKGPRPPAHFRCRSTTVIVAEGIPPADDITYGEWIAKQTKDVQVQALGKTRAELLDKGELPFADLFKRNDQFILLKELKEIEKQAFDKINT